MNRRTLLQYGIVSALSLGIGFTAASSQQSEPQQQPESEEPDNTLDDKVRILEHDFMTFETTEGDEVADVNGFLVNVTDETIETVVVLADFLDGDGNYVIFETTEIVDLEPDQRTEFNVPFPNIPEEDLFSRVDQYELSIYEDASEADLDKDYEFAPVDDNFE